MAACGAGRAAGQGTGAAVVTGVVVDSATGMPLPGARVDAARGRLRAVTDSAGRFVLRGVERGQGRVRVRRVGYADGAAEWELRGDSVRVKVALASAVIPLAEIRVVAEGLDAQVKAGASAVWTIGAAELAASTASDVLTMLRDRYTLRPVRCRVVEASRVGGRGCFYIRGTPTRACVLVDEVRAPGGLDDLVAYRPDEVGRVYVFRGGSVIAVYTRWYMKQVARDGAPFRTVDSMTTSECP
ncbi:MAG: TonB-dependent outer membrane protein SusC/RagA [Gemmatimonadetes bacterium]|nr:TonB-dependent outer membrane protein SusC/RagA [Gemmatimonadota bacterium]